MTGYQALRESAALLDLSGRGLLKVTGEDRVRLLHAMTTNHVQQMKTGDLCYAFFLNAQGRIQADAHILAMEDALLLDIEPERREFLPEYLDKYIIADDVTIEDWSDRLSAVAVEGPKAHEVLRSAGAAEVPDPGYWVPWESQLLAAISATGSAGYRAYVPAHAKDAFVERLLRSGALKASPEEARIVRLENAHPRYGEELTDAHIPHETRALNALHFSKGCYLGQEIVERVRSRGHVNRLLVQLRIATDQPPAPGTKIQAGGADAGEIASAAYSPAVGAVIAMGYVRAEHVTAKPAMDVSGSAAEITERQPN